MTNVKFFKHKEKKLRRMIEKNPDDPDNYLKLGKLYFLNEDYDKSARVYENGLKIAPRDKALLLNCAVAREAMNNLDGAKKLYLEILSIDPNNKPAQERLDNITSF